MPAAAHASESSFNGSRRNPAQSTMLYWLTCEWYMAKNGEAIVILKTMFVGNFFSGPMQIAGGDVGFTANTFTTDSTFACTFLALSLLGNNLTFNNSAPITFTISGTGNITSMGNVADAG